MTKTLLASILAMSLGLASVTATPAQAGEDDAAKIVVGALALLALSKAVQDKKATVQVSRQNSYEHSHGAHGRHSHEWQKSHGQKKKLSKTLPGKCQFDVKTARGREWPVFGKACLQKRMQRADRLPAWCEKTINTNRGPRDVYDAHCLSQVGFKVATRN